MTDIVISRDYGGFGLSTEAHKFLLNLKHPVAIKEQKDEDSMANNPKRIDGPTQDWHYGDIKRDDPLLVRVVKELGTKAASSVFAKLEIVTIPNDVDWYVEEYDGNEWISEVHRTW